jgi:hypothetical protein
MEAVKIPGEYIRPASTEHINGKIALHIEIHNQKTSSTDDPSIVPILDWSREEIYKWVLSNCKSILVLQLEMLKDDPS